VGEENTAVDELKNRYRKAVFIWMDMVFSIFLYAFVVEILKMNSPFLRIASPLQEGGIPVFLLLGFAVMTFFLIKYIRNQIISDKLSSNPADSKSPLSPKITKLLRASLVSNAICETVAILGLILFVLTKNPFDFYVFMVLSLIYFAFSFPRYTQWEEWIQEGEWKESSGVFAPR
jgi:F0F1-type ATP synthase membrane subunit c/vacuolar-type H+-ATPase subunit K